MIGIPLALVASNGVEWLFHKYVLHGLGRNRRSCWSYHFYEHHRAARRNGMVDAAYEAGVFHWNGQGKEALALAAGALAVLPLAPVAPFFAATSIWCAVDYYRKHKRSHLDPEWAREHLPWHYAHHMGRRQDQNWCVTRPWFDRLLGTVDPMPPAYPARHRMAHPALRDGTPPTVASEQVSPRTAQEGALAEAQASSGRTGRRASQGGAHPRNQRGRASRRGGRRRG